jgi:hypothetical protein
MADEYNNLRLSVSFTIRVREFTIVCIIADIRIMMSSISISVTGNPFWSIFGIDDNFTGYRFARSKRQREVFSFPPFFFLLLLPRSHTARFHFELYKRNVVGTLRLIVQSSASTTSFTQATTTSSPSSVLVDAAQFSLARISSDVPIDRKSELISLVGGGV